MSRRALPPLDWQYVAIWANSVVPVRSRVSARQICPLVAAGKSVGEAPPWESNTKFAVIDAAMSVPALEVVDHVAGIQFGFTAHPAVFVGCVPPRTSTVFCAARGVTPSSNAPPSRNNIRSLFIASLSLPLRLVRLWRESKTW
jgi:hypothetical protein